MVDTRGQTWSGPLWRLSGSGDVRRLHWWALSLHGAADGIPRQGGGL